ncbi:hypothetical protein H4R34_005321 [Dimargaris verticillata]|uniref:Mediator of RNA polymerase II transcription subunit 20 n=1 Tax=Dimargaris verticillata TaxID=2761393 RepID=A0A9W8AZ34_9FUNG|nr:hypothetical protein H4R34_005321 [Dimargaris verticillata]
MGVTCVFRWVNATGSTSLSQLNAQLTQRLFAANLGRWTVTCRLYREIPPALDPAATTVGSPTMAIGNKSHEKMLLLLTHTAEPARQYAMVDESCIVETDRELEAIVHKLKNLWVARQSSQIDGHLYDLGDFRVRMGNMMVGTANKGVIVEVEYVPCCYPQACQRILAEFIGLLMPSNAQLSFSVRSTTTNGQQEPGSQSLTSSTALGMAPSAVAAHPEVLVMDYGRAGIYQAQFTALNTAYQYFALFRADNLL